MIADHSPSSLLEPLVSIIVLNYNGARWLQRCLDSLRAQTVFDQIEVIVADNLSSDGSDRLAAKILESWPRGAFIQHGWNRLVWSTFSQKSKEPAPVPPRRWS